MEKTDKELAEELFYKYYFGLEYSGFTELQANIAKQSANIDLKNRIELLKKVEAKYGNANYPTYFITEEIESLKNQLQELDNL